MHANSKQLHIGTCNGCENSESVIACNYAARSGSHTYAMHTTSLYMPYEAPYTAARI